MDSKWQMFLNYQNGNTDYPSFDNALSEILITKRKLSHWIWYILPIDKPSATFKNLFIVNKNEVDKYLDISSLRNNYILMILCILQQLNNMDTCYYNDFIPFNDLKKTYNSVVMFSNTKKYVCVKKVCNDLVNLLKDYIYEHDKKHKHFQNMLLNCVRKAE